MSVEPFHLFRYLDEEGFRFNTRKANDAERFVRTLSDVAGKRLTYNELIGEAMPLDAARGVANAASL